MPQVRLVPSDRTMFQVASLHARADANINRNWNDEKMGCACSACRSIRSTHRYNNATVRLELK